MKLVRPEDWRPVGVDELEPRAWEALRETTRSVCVTAGAGAGKTEFLAQKANYLLATGICPAPKRILAISYKRDAARNLAERIGARCPPDQARRFVSMTFDGFTKHLLDQFQNALPVSHRPGRDYRVMLGSDNELGEFLTHEGSGFGTRALGRLIANCPLPIGEQDVSDQVQDLLESYWTYQYEDHAEVRLTFAMINRLVEFLLRRNDRIRRALQATYPFVFLDEFQDATDAQFELLQTAFEDSGAAFTAVGDDKQKIMVWAGAMEEAFGAFTQRFDALSIGLQSNWRSHEGLVELQHVIAQRIVPAIERPIARGARRVDGSVAAIWEYDDRPGEVADLAQWIADEVGSGRIKAHDLAILVRMLPHQVEEELGPELATHGVAIRNVARTVGSIVIQDLLTEELTRIVSPFLRLGASRRDAKAWSEAHAAMRWLMAEDGDDEIAQQRAASRIEATIRSIRGRMAELRPSEQNAATLVGFAIAAIGEQLIRRSTPTYARDPDYARVRDGFSLLLQESATGAGSWTEALNCFDGVGQVQLMTVHKAKGLEFHTVIFFGLDGSSWRGLRDQRPEELNTFFVAFTRAQQRAFFTHCTGRGRAIQWLDNLFGGLLPRENRSPPAPEPAW